MNIEGGIALAFATFVFACIPGPGVSAVVAQSLARGFRTGAAFSAGLVLGDMLYLLLALYGMGWVASQVGPWFVVLKWVGAAYLVFLGVKCWIAATPPTQRVASQRPPVRATRSFLAGLAVTLGNPKAIAFYCGFLPGFVHMPELTGGDVAIIAAIMVPIVSLVPIAYAWLAARGRQVVLSTRAWKAVNRGAGTVMIGTGVAIVTE